MLFLSSDVYPLCGAYVVNIASVVGALLSCSVVVMILWPILFIVLMYDARSWCISVATPP